MDGTSMTLDVVDSQNEKIGSLELSDEVFGGRVNTGVIWEAVVHQLACEHRGTHATKTRGRVRGSGKKPWRQKGTGRARVGQIRNPLWRGGGTVFGPQPRSYAYRLPKKVIRGALRNALTQKFRDAVVLVVDELAVSEPRTRHAARSYWAGSTWRARPCWSMCIPIRTCRSRCGISTAFGCRPPGVSARGM